MAPNISRIGHRLTSISLALTLSVIFASAFAAETYHAKLVSLDAPKYMIGGEEYSVQLVYKNAGDSDWTPEEGISLSWAGQPPGDEWGSLVVGDLFDKPVAPGDSIDIEFTIVAPMLAGQFDLRWRLQDSKGAAFGETATLYRVRVETAENQARMLTQLVPDEIKPRDRFSVLFQVQNIGRTTWESGQGYHLALVSEAPWSPKRIDLAKGTYVTPGETAVFKASMDAPATAGEYAFQWQMRQQDTHFGEHSALVDISVGQSGPMQTRFHSEFVHQDLNKAMLGGDFYEVVVQYKNNSQHSWYQDEVMLSSPGGKGVVWAVDEVGLSQTAVPPGSFASFRFTVQAPFDPGVYAMQWQLKHIGQGLFGEPSARRLIEVK